MQNKMYFATNGFTAAEIIAYRANAELPFMGLTAFKGEQPKKQEALVAKNYLSESEITNLKFMVNTYLDVAEWKAREQTPMKMKDWLVELDEFIKYRKKPLLTHKGKVSHERAVEIATEQYDLYSAKMPTELTQAERDFLYTIHETYKLLERKKPK